MSRGQIRHNDLEVSSYNDLIDGRVKVDSWNLNYSKKKKKLKKKKVAKDTRRRMDELQNIYGVDAKTLAGLQKGQMPKNIESPARNGYGTQRDSEMSFRSTQNTFMKNQSSADKNHIQSRASMDGMSNMFSFGGTKSKRWMDIESTLKGSQM